MATELVKFDQHAVTMTRCTGCGALVWPETPVCDGCRKDVDVEAARQVLEAKIREAQEALAAFERVAGK
jgi:uncharacterized OB-fold protein